LAKNLVKAAQVFAEARGLSGEQAPSEYFQNLSMEDVSGVPMRFADLSDAEREVFFTTWIRETAKSWADKADQNPAFALTLEMQEGAMSRALSATQAKGLSDYRSFAARLNAEVAAAMPGLSSNINKLPVLPSPSRAVTGKEAIKAAIMENFKRGMVMTMFRGTSSFPFNGGYTGHATVLTDYRPDWKINADDAHLWTMTSSWGNDTPWGSTFHGVGPEPLGEWNNNIPNYSGNDGNTVKLWQIGRQVFIWNWFSSHYEWREASPAEYEFAADLAVSRGGIGYNYLFMKDLTIWYYCSQLAWHSWKIVDPAIDIDWSSWDLVVSPTDIEGSDKTRMVFEGQN